MMKFLIALVVLAGMAIGVAPAQCPGGVCNVRGGLVATPRGQSYFLPAPQVMVQQVQTQVVMPPAVVVNQVRQVQVAPTWRLVGASDPILDGPSVPQPAPLVQPSPLVFPDPVEVDDRPTGPVRRLVANVRARVQARSSGSGGCGCR